MANLTEIIKAELENIDEIFVKLPSHSKLPDLSVLELAGVAALLHNFYNGLENIIKQIFLSKKLEIPTGKSWHKELLEKAVTEKVISEECKNTLGQYLAFRHLFIHTYALDLYSEKMGPLVESSKEVYLLFQKEIGKFN
jgi:hypothetical protein